ncbi:NADH:flavin oxidoreductase [Oenococcus oeni]
MKLNQIFSPYQLKTKFELRNRLVLSPLNIQSSLFDGTVSLNDLDFHRRVAKHVGLDVVGSAYVSNNGSTAFGSISVADDNKIEGLTKLASVIHRDGSKAILQLVHAGRMTNHLITQGSPAVAPSPIKAMHGQFDIPIELTETMIEQIIHDFETAAKRAILAGFDGVELHGANTFLLQQFMSPASNKRSDKFGGSLINRIQFPLLVVQRIIKLVQRNLDHSFIIGYRISPEEFESNGLKLASNLILMRTLKKIGIDYLSLSLHRYDQQSIANNELATFPIASIVKQAIGKDLPIIISGEINKRFDLERATGDLFASGRKLMSDPNWPVKLNSENFQMSTTSKISYTELSNLSHRNKNSVGGFG